MNAWSLRHVFRGRPLHYGALNWHHVNYISTVVLPDPETCPACVSSTCGGGDRSRCTITLYDNTCTFIILASISGKRLHLSDETTIFVHKRGQHRFLLILVEDVLRLRHLETWVSRHFSQFEYCRLHFNPFISACFSLLAPNCTEQPTLF